MTRWSRRCTGSRLLVAAGVALLALWLVGCPPQPERPTSGGVTIRAAEPTRR